ncbi:hypothetical protein STEG23_021691, partial [Scotinomys teguina]
NFILAVEGASVCCEFVLLFLVNKEAALAYGSSFRLFPQFHGDSKLSDDQKDEDKWVTPSNRLVASMYIIDN